MDDKHSSDISADELLKKLRENMSEEGEEAASDGRKKYKFRRSGKITAPVSEEDIKAQMPEDSGYTFESPVPRSEIEDLDLDELMRKYLPEEDYRRMTEKTAPTESEEEDEFVRTLSSIDLPEEGDEEDGEESEDAKGYTAPDEELYMHLSAGGKVCDVPELDGEYDSMADTTPAPLRPMTDIDKTIAFISDDDDEEEGGFISVREIMAAQNAASDDESDEAEDEEPTKTVTDLTKTLEIEITDEGDEATSDTVTFTAVSEDEPEEIPDGGDDENTEDEPEFDFDSELGDDIGLDESVFDELFGRSESKSDTYGITDEVDTDFDPFFTEPEPDTEPENEPETEEPEPTSEEDDITAETQTGTDDSGETVSAEDTALVPVEEEDELGEDVADDELDETDVNLMVAFGMDEELEAAIGKESADKLRTDTDNLLTDTEPEKEKPKPEPVKEPIKEFVSPTEIKGIFESYKAEYGKSAIRLFVIAAVALLLFFYENLGIFGGKQPDVFNPEFYPVVHIMAGFQLLLIGFAVLYKDVIAGFKNLISKKPTVESLLPVMFGASALYSVIACFFGAGSTILGFNFPIALALFFFAFGRRLDLRREIMTFRIISSKRSKFALEKLDIIDAELETKAFDKFLPKQPDIFRINKTAFIDGYFRRTGEYSSVKSTLNAFIPATLVSFVAGIIIGLIAKGNFADGMSAGYAAFAFSLPVSVFFTFSLPMFRASKVSYDDGSAIVGEGALDEYTTASSISFDDREVFPTAGVKLRSIKVFGSGRLDTAIYYMASIYSCIGGPLSDVLNVATADIGRSQDIEVISIDSDGIETVVDGKHLYAGKADYLRHNGYLPVTDPEDEEIEGGDISILFLVCDDEVVAKFYVRYRIDPEFEATLKSLYKSGICVGIKTVDPNINDEMLSTRIRLTKYPVRVLKYEDLNDRSRGADRTDSGIVSKKSVKALLRAFTLCDKTKHVTKTNLMIAALSLLGGIAITAVLAFLGSVAALSSVYVALYQLFWIAAVYLLSRFLLM